VIAHWYPFAWAGYLFLSGTLRLGRSIVAVLSSATSFTTPFSAQTYQVRIASTLPIWATIGSTAVVTANSAATYLPANVPEYFAVTSGQVLNFISTHLLSCRLLGFSCALRPRGLRVRSNFLFRDQRQIRFDQQQAKHLSDPRGRAACPTAASARTAAQSCFCVYLGTRRRALSRLVLTRGKPKHRANQQNFDVTQTGRKRCTMPAWCISSFVAFRNNRIG